MMKLKNYTLLFGLAVASCSGYSQGMQRIDSVTPMAAPNLANPPVNYSAPSTPPPSVALGPNYAGQAGMPVPMPRQNMADRVIDTITPLNAKEVLDVRGEIAARLKAGTQPINTVATPVIRVATVDMGPGSKPEVIRITRTEGSSVSFMDASGRPWEVEGADNFNPRAIDMGRAAGHSLVFSAIADDSSGSVAVRLKGLASPITLKVVAGGLGIREVDYSVEMQIPRYMPGNLPASGPVVNQLNLGGQELMAYLLRTPPKDAKQLMVEGLPGATAWQSASGKLILRTNQLVASPNSTRRQSSFDGVTVYELPITPLVLVSVDGALVNARVTGFSVTQGISK